MTSPGEVTGLLAAARLGDEQAANRAVTALYDELRRLARSQLAREHAPPTLSATDLVHEAYLRLAGAASSATDRRHFMAIAARAMRRVLVDQARRRKAAKRGEGFLPITLSELHPAQDPDNPDELLELNDALEKLDERQREIVELRHFAGLDDSEIGQLLEISDRTVRREWVRARARLYQLIYGSTADGGSTP